MLTIKKLDYSVRPWRLVRDGWREIEISSEFDHPLMGKTTISKSIGGSTKKEALEETLAFLELMLEERRRRGSI